MTSRPYSGIWPVAPTPFAEDGSLDLPGMRRVIDCMVDQDVDGHGFSHCALPLGGPTPRGSAASRWWDRD